MQERQETATDPPVPEIDDALRDIEKLVADQRVAEARTAIAALSRRLYAVPGATPPLRAQWSKLAACCVGVNELAAAAEMYLQIEKVFGPDQELSLDIVEALARFNLKGAAERLDRLLPSLPRTGEVLRHLVRIHREFIERFPRYDVPTRLIGQARAIEDEWIALDPGNFTAWRESANASILRGEAGRGAALTRGARKCLDPDRVEDALFWCQLHDLQYLTRMESDRVDSAVIAFKHAPHNSAVWRRLAPLVPKLGERIPKSDIDRMFEQMLAQKKLDVKHWLVLTDWLARSGRREQAMVAVTKALELDPLSTIGRQILRGLEDETYRPPPDAAPPPQLAPSLGARMLAFLGLRAS
jgi:tetratricopeptide (TPR) repeat protein